MEWMETLKENLSMLIIIVLILAVGGLSLNSFRNSIQAGISTTAINNESVTWVNNTYTALANSNNIGLSCNSVSNNSAWTVIINPGNYTCTTSGIRLTQNTSAPFATAVFVNYSYTPYNAAYNVTSNGMIGATNASAQFGSIGTLMAVAALIGVVITAFYLSSKY